MVLNAKWIRPAQTTGDVCPVYSKQFSPDQNLSSVAHATLSVTAMGVYEASLNGKTHRRFRPCARLDVLSPPPAGTDL